MDYIRISVAVEPFSEMMVDILTAELGELGCEAFEECPGGFNAYIVQPAFDRAALDELVARYGAAGDLRIACAVEVVESENWNAVWESNFEPVVIGERCTIRATFHQGLAPTDYEIVITPRMAFGTGHHETTYLAAEALLSMDLDGKRVLDMGCGTGILAILAAMKGAAEILAIDNDPQATENAAVNCRANGVERIGIETGDAALLVAGRPFDVIVANINRNILLNDMGAYSLCLARGGLLLLSGFYAEDCALLEQEAAAHGLVKDGVALRNGWALLAFRTV